MCSPGRLAAGGAGARRSRARSNAGSRTGHRRWAASAPPSDGGRPPLAKRGAERPHGRAAVLVGLGGCSLGGLALLDRLVLLRRLERDHEVVTVGGRVRGDLLFYPAVERELDQVLHEGLHLVELAC